MNKINYEIRGQNKESDAGHLALGQIIFYMQDEVLFCIIAAKLKSETILYLEHIV